MVRNRLYHIFAVLALALVFGVLVWILTLHGAVAMLTIDSLLRILFNVVGLLGVTLLGLFLWRRQIITLRPLLYRWLMLPILLLIIINILVPAGVFTFVSGYPYTPAGDLPQRLYIQNHIPGVTDTKVHFAAAGDAHFGAGTNNPDITVQMVRQIADQSHEFDFFFSLGDLVEMGNKQADWQKALTAIGPITSSIPTGFVPGNHDTLFNGIKLYRDYALPQESSLDQPFYYRADIGTVHFLILDVEWSAETFDQKQAEWLENELRNIPAGDWKIVLSHGFYFSSGYMYHGYNWSDNRETIRAVTPLFEKYGVDLVLSSHNHQLEYLRKNGVTYLVCGGFGGKFDPVRTYVSPASQWYAGETFGFADITVNGSRADIIFRGPQYQEIQTFTLNKN
jgi:UDP-2,3-diacylglucosamine pyrophosphatase LpxH